MKVYTFSSSLISNRIIIYFIASLIILLFVISEFDLSVPFNLLFWNGLAVFLISYSFRQEEKKLSLIVFNITFLIYLTFAILGQRLYVTDPFSTFYYAQDSMGFYSEIFRISESSSFPQLSPFDIQTGNARNGTAMLYLGWIISRISYAIGGHNPPIIHIMVVAWSTAMINVYLYNSARYFFEKRTSLILAVTYGIFSYSLVYSTILLRDMHIALLLAIGMYMLLGPFSIKRLLIMGLMALITWMFRPASGFFYLLVIFAYIYISDIRNKKLLNYLFRFVGIVIIFIVVISQLNDLTSEDYLLERATGYSERSDDKGIISTGKSGVIYNLLPSEVYPVIRIIQTQWNPFGFPSYITVPSGFLNSGQTQYLSFGKNIASFFWFIIMTIIAYGLLKKRIRNAIPKKLFYTLIIGLSLIVLGGFVINDVRRILGGYPFIFLTAAFILSIAGKTKAKSIVNYSVFAFLFLALIFSII